MSTDGTSVSTVPFPLTFRVATVKDVPIIHSLINAAFCSDKTDQVWLTPERIEVFPVSYLTTKFSEPDTVLLVALDTNAVIVACCYLRRATATPERPIPHGWLGTLAVTPELHNKGVGRQLLVHAEQYIAREWGVRRMEMNVVSSRVELRAWYKKLGYAETGHTEPFPYGSGEAEGDGERRQKILRDGLYMIDLGKDLAAA
ncbi:uncharacterized protein HMPREF1541_06920 [Cyphellophora europaea CBS 101466]|uniref:N-acetyltransferase domain-containing protein n=1 Tax=Cyphellophora europaea (strain CBS 101466) TaxID=1220924 RepID=W2RT54_CYPE1|nr:uncharacterized protein HMPREF1541_06920 [Cyphellophora europaea CBS 101466]ETN38879.1 hypothetical protein HMPREF1541_06920 [Cyphellophora europaea CBS 101466]